MFDTIKTVHLDDYGREVPTFHHVSESGVSLADIVAAYAAQGETLIEVRYIR